MQPTGNTPQQPGTQTNVCPVKDTICNYTPIDILNVIPHFEPAHCKTSPT